MHPKDILYVCFIFGAFERFPATIARLWLAGMTLGEIVRALSSIQYPREGAERSARE